MKSVMTNQERFASISKPNIQRSLFDRSCGRKTTFNAGDLIPVFVDEALPGDTFTMKASLFGRLATPIKPVMDNIFIDIHFFSVPYRLVWQNWKRFNGEQDNPSDSTDYLIPTIPSLIPPDQWANETLGDYMGIPTYTNIYGGYSALPFRAYRLIWNEWYRDEDLQDSVDVSLGDGPDIIHSPSGADPYAVLPRGKRKDYFTSARPWAQKADPVAIPLGGTAPIVPIEDPFGNYYNSQTKSITGGFTGPGGLFSNSASQIGVGGIFNAILNTEDTHQVDLSSQTLAIINTLRESFGIQQIYELDARGGTRYTELILAHFGVQSPDARLQRPEYLGGGTVPLNVMQVAQTSDTAAGTPQGNLAAFGTFSSNKGTFHKTFTEHEIVIGLVSARADLNYQQGLNRMWSRQTRFDFFWPSLAHLGEQAILNKEIYAQGNPTDDDVFGYQERYAEYRYKPSEITGKYRSNDPTSLDVWHLAQDFSSLPTLSDEFIQENPPISRIIAVPSEPQFLLDCYFDLKCARPIPVRGTPGMMRL